MNMENKVRKLRFVVPDAREIRTSDGHCPVCKTKDSMLWFDTHEFHGEEVEHDGELWMQGGLFCASCGWGNAGAVPMKQWDDATIALPELDFDEAGEGDKSGDADENSRYHYPKK